MDAQQLAEVRQLHSAFAICVAGEIVRMRRGLPHWSWLNRHFREARDDKGETT